MAQNVEVMQKPAEKPLVVIAPKTKYVLCGSLFKVLRYQDKTVFNEANDAHYEETILKTFDELAIRLKMMVGVNYDFNKTPVLSQAFKMNQTLTKDDLRVFLLEKCKPAI